MPDTTIDSAKYNTNVHDVETDLNTPRPIVAGGTGASDQAGALFNMSGEEAAQVVTNWDSMVWVPGSFYAASSATGTAPANGHAFAGICYINEPLANPPTNQNLVLEARDLDAALTVPVWLPNTVYNIGDSARDATDNSVWKATAQNIGAAGHTFAEIRASAPGVWVAAPAIPVTRYVRIKKAGVWNAWAPDVVPQSVRYDAAQILTAGQQTQARQNIYAAPFDAQAYSGLQINGSMEVSQQWGTTGQTLTNATPFFGPDMWKVAYTHAANTAVFTTGQVTAASFPAALPGYQNAIRLAATTAMASLANGDNSALYNYIEGYRITRLAWGTPSAQPITIAAWVYSTASGVMALRVNNGAGNRCYHSDVTLAVGWNFVVKTIPGDTAGVWATDNTRGIVIVFIGAGKEATPVTAGSWTTAPVFQTTASTNLFVVNNNSILITGVVVLPGTDAPSAARSALIMRPYDQELLTCRRYWMQFNTTWIGTGTTPSVIYYGNPMRGTPTAAGGGAGFALGNNMVSGTNIVGLVCYQTTAAYQNMTFDARL